MSHANGNLLRPSWQGNSAAVAFGSEPGPDEAEAEAEAETEATAEAEAEGLRADQGQGKLGLKNTMCQCLRR